MIEHDAGRTSVLSRIIITGANGSGKSHLAKRLAVSRPDFPIVAFDALKLTTQWQTRPRLKIDAALAAHVAKPAWIIEGGPTLLQIACPRADCVIWLDPPLHIRTWRLFARPWRHLGKTRPELPDGNPDTLWRQGRFAIQSLLKTHRTNAFLGQHLCDKQGFALYRCQSRQDIETAFAHVAYH